MSQDILALTQDNFEEQVLKAAGPVLVDFWADWCGPCRMVAPIVEEIAEQYRGKLKVGKLNVDEQGPIAARYNIESIPTLILFKGGQETERIIGALPKKNMIAKLDKAL